MTARIMPHVNFILNQVPSFEKLNAGMFVGCLLVETYQRFSKQDASTIDKISIMKATQLLTYLADKPPFHSWKVLYPTAILVPFLYSDWCLSQIGKLYAKSRLDHQGNQKPVVPSMADRPPFVFFFACAKEAINIAAKVLNSLSAGIIAQKLFNGTTEGTVRDVVTVSLLALSALNVYKVVYPKAPREY